MGMTDLALWSRAVDDGDADAFGTLFDRHATTIYNYCHRRGLDWSTAEDLTSVVFLEAWRRRNEFRPTDSDHVLAWLLGVATNVVRNRRRAMRRHSAALARLPRPGAEPDFGDAVAERLDQRALGRGLLEWVHRLPRRERDVVLLCLCTGLTYEQAAIALDVPVGTVRSRLSRGRARLRRMVATNADAPGHDSTHFKLVAADEGGD